MKRYRAMVPVEISLYPTDNGRFLACASGLDGSAFFVSAGDTEESALENLHSRLGIAHKDLEEIE
jgi:predicted RNase H-like HicB family nuclease